MLPRQEKEVGVFSFEWRKGVRFWSDLGVWRVDDGTYEYHGRECHAAFEEHGDEFIACFELEGRCGGLGFDGLELGLGPCWVVGEVEELVVLLS